MDEYRQATREELDLAVAWASDEGWNPGVEDASIFWGTDPDGFVAIEREGEVIGVGSVVSYDNFGFMGFFIVRKDLRGQGIGGPFWHWRKARLQDRLKPDSAIGMDGVFEIQPFYAKGGFVFTHRNIRMEGVGEKGEVSADLCNLTEAPFEQVAEFDRHCFGFDREAFLRRWIEPKKGVALGLVIGGELKGYGVIRRCERGFKIGPLFAKGAAAAESLFVGLSNAAVKEPIFLDVPECHAAAMDLAKRHGMKEVFGCARMIAGPVPDLPWDEIYGVTTFELG